MSSEPEENTGCFGDFTGCTWVVLFIAFIVLSTVSFGMLTPVLVILFGRILGMTTRK